MNKLDKWDSKKNNIDDPIKHYSVRKEIAKELEKQLEEFTKNSEVYNHILEENIAYK